MVDASRSLSKPPLRQSLYDVGPADAPPAAFNLAAYCLSATEAFPDKAALTVIGASDGALERSKDVWTFGALDAAVRRAASGLQALGLERGDRVALRLGNTPRFPLLFFATIAAGGVAAPTSAQLSAEETRRILIDSGARFLCVDPGLEIDLSPLGDAAPRVLAADAIGALFETTTEANMAETGPDDPAFLVYTSGATGRPKGVLHAQRSAWARRMMWRDWYDLGPDDRMLHAGAFNWTYTLGAGLMDPWAAGATSIIYNGPRDPALWPVLAADTEATLFAAVPTVFRQILKYGEDVATRMRTLRHGLTAGEKLPEAVRDAWMRTVGKPLYEAYGMSECSTFVSSSPAAPTKPGWIGRPQAGRRVALVPQSGDDAAATTPVAIGAVGVVAVSRDDPGLMLGYWNRPDEAERAFRGDWFLTGDLAEMDVDGYLAYRGRGDDLMNAMGYRVAPQEVEDALIGHEAVAECAVTELRVRSDATAIAAFVVPTEDAAERWDDASLAQALRDHCAERLAAYKSPREFVIVDALPRTANGKVQRRVLAERYAKA